MFDELVITCCPTEHGPVPHNGVQDLYDEHVQNGTGTLSIAGYWDDSAEGYYMDIYACDGSKCYEIKYL